ncbi:hypothetical protein, partial [Actinomyces slackii]|uniref:hypothetical protein n=1 Tax=Actinomyces slackii TaxID=52774 RepID=UPI0039EBE86E
PTPAGAGAGGTTPPTTAASVTLGARSTALRLLPDLGPRRRFVHWSAIRGSIDEKFIQGSPCLQQINSGSNQ